MKNLIPLENRLFHQSLNLLIINNVILLLQPPYYPELNPIEKNW